MLNFLPPTLTFLVILLIWQLVVRVLDVPTYIFPAPTDVVAQEVPD